MLNAQYWLTRQTESSTTFITYEGTLPSLHIFPFPKPNCIEPQKAYLIKLFHSSMDKRIDYYVFIQFQFSVIESKEMES